MTLVRAENCTALKASGMRTLSIIYERLRHEHNHRVQAIKDNICSISQSPLSIHF